MSLTNCLPVPALASDEYRACRIAVYMVSVAPANRRSVPSTHAEKTLLRTALVLYPLRFSGVELAASPSFKQNFKSLRRHVAADQIRANRRLVGEVQHPEPRRHVRRLDIVLLGEGDVAASELRRLVARSHLERAKAARVRACKGEMRHARRSLDKIQDYN